MALMRIRVDEDPVLRRKSSKIERMDPTILQLMDDMAETMYKAPGIGLAAPQVGVNLRVIVVDVGEESGLLKMANPKIVETEGMCMMTEGCLSVPGLLGDVERPEKIIVKAMGPEGKYFRMEAEGMLARCLQHEIDHLDGILYTDKAISVWEPTEEDLEESPGEVAEANALRNTGSAVEPASSDKSGDTEVRGVPLSRMENQPAALFQVEG